MSGRPLLLDLFCGAGGCAMGYFRAGFEVLGIDIKPQPHYPFAVEQMDALQYLADWGDRFAVIHASPPCQSYSRMKRAVGQSKAPRLIGQLRQMLEATGRPYVIENVEGAELRGNVVLLCGTMFGLRVRRHRLFELGSRQLILTPPCQCRLGVATGRLVGHVVSGKPAPGRRPRFGYTEADRRAAIGVPWMTTVEARQAIPPAYTEFLGANLLQHLEALT
jgi:DNA (cytosine-5)-methyltransferase 1